MKTKFTVLAFLVLSSQSHAYTCGPLSIQDLITATASGTIAREVACPEQVATVQRQPAPFDCKKVTLDAMASSLKPENRSAALNTLLQVSENFDCPDDVLANARTAARVITLDILKAFVSGK